MLCQLLPQESWHHHIFLIFSGDRMPNLSEMLSDDTKLALNPSFNEPLQAELLVNTPGQLRVIKRNGKAAPFDISKISVAVTKAFLAVEGGQAAASSRIHELVKELATHIEQAFLRRLPTGGTLHIEDIQDQVELALMRAGEHKAARAYVLYREERRKAREQETTTQPAIVTDIHVTLHDGARVPLDVNRLRQTITDACQGLDKSEIDADFILEDTLRNLYDGIPIDDVEKACIICTRPLVERDPNYSFVTARLLLSTLRKEAFTFLQLNTDTLLTDTYRHCFQDYIQRGVELELLDPKLKEFDLEKIVNALKPERDFQFTYLSLQTLYDRYFIHSHGVRFELPQAFFMRVAMGLALNERNREARAIEFYNLLSSFDYMSSTPTLFNSGTLRPQLSSCFLTTVPDDLEGIYGAIKDNALLSKFAGGLGNDWTPVRGMGARIKGTNGKSLGVVPFMNVANATAVAVNQGGKRKGAVCAYLETWHRDIEEFLELRKNTGDERRRTHDMNTANWVPDLFMKRVIEGGNWTLFSPDEVPDLHNLYGLAFEKAYLNHEKRAAHGELKNTKNIPAINLWRKMLTMLFETGHPWITFKDPCNLRSPQQHSGIIHSSNLCTEITLNTSTDEIAVCNLGSINLTAHLTANGELDKEKLRRTVHTAMRMLDNVIDINYYTVPQARKSNLKHRPVGLGIMGFQDALYQIGIPYASQEAVEFADTSMELVSYFAIEASSDLAKERGSYQNFEGSLWSKGILPIDSIELLQKSRAQYLEQDRSKTLDWDALRTKVMTQGMRNSNTMAIAPTATISNICGVSQSIEPTYQNLFVKSNMSGEFTVINPYLVTELKKLNLWDNVMVNDLKYYDGSVKNIARIPENIKQLYATAFEIDPRWLVEAGSRRQKWIDQSQSLNLYMAQPSGKKLDELYRFAFIKGLKTTYYMRTMGATHTEKSTVETGTLNAVQATSTDILKACSIDDPDCESCQ
jgi:ribonucleoside-diphosphate reductase alpha chain